MCINNQNTLMSSITTSVTCISETRFKWTLYSIKKWLLIISSSLCLDRSLCDLLNFWDLLLMINWILEQYVESWKITQKHTELLNICCQWKLIDAASLSKNVEK